MELALDSLDTTALTKAQLADALFDQLGLNKREAKDFIDAFFEIVSAELVQGVNGGAKGSQLTAA